MCLSQAGHGVMSSQQWINTSVGFVLHTFLLVPFFAWRHSHHLHHKATGSIERDENFVPATRTDLKLKDATKVTKQDYREMFEETPIFTLVRIFFMQAVGMQAYFAYNALGSPMYPAGTNVRQNALSNATMLTFSPASITHPTHLYSRRSRRKKLSFRTSVSSQWGASLLTGSN